MDYYFDSAFAKFDKQTPEGKKDIGKIILPAIKRLINKIEQSFWVQKLSAKLGVSEDAVLDELKNIKLDSVVQPHKETNFIETKNKNFTSGGRKKLLEERIISLILKDPENLNLIEDSHYCLFSESVKNFIDNLKKITPPEGGDLKSLFTDFSQKDEYKDFFGTLALRSEIELENDGPEEVELCLLQLKDIELRNTMESLSKEMKNQPSQEKEEDLKKEFNKQAKELHNKLATK
jgi:DNA primase